MTQGSRNRSAPALEAAFKMVDEGAADLADFVAASPMAYEAKTVEDMHRLEEIALDFFRKTWADVASPFAAQVLSEPLEKRFKRVFAERFYVVAMVSGLQPKGTG